MIIPAIWKKQQENIVKLELSDLVKNHFGETKTHYYRKKNIFRDLQLFYF